MPIIVNFFITIVMCFSIYISNIIMLKPNKNVLFNTTLPFSELENEEVLKIIRNFKKENVKYVFINAILNIPSFLVKSESFSIIYLFVWISAVIVIYYLVLNKYITRIRQLKMKNNWFIKDKHIISVDTEVSRLKDKMPISILWFIPSFMISIVIIIYTLINKSDLNSYMIILVCTSIFTSVIFLILYKIFSKGRVKVYSDDSNVNLACNLIYKRIWSIVLVALATIQSFFTIFECFIYSKIIVILSIMVVLVFFTIVVGYTKIRDTQNKILMAADNVIYTDDDEYWGIMFYNNPNDSSLMVDKRIGMGMTMNIGHPKAKIAITAFAILLMLVLVPVVFMVAKTTSAEFTLSVDDDKISIDAPIYGIDFNKKDIEEVSLISSLPKGLRTNGTGTSHIALGNYKFDGYGPSKSFVHRDLEKIIVIKLSDKYVFLTGNNEEETDKYYNELQSYLDRN